MRLITFLIAVCLCMPQTLSAQMTSKEIRKAQWKGDMTNSGVGLTFYKPKFTDELNPIGQWQGINLLFGVFHIGIEQGYLYQSQVSPIANKESRASNFYLGASLPLPFLTLGKYRSYNNSFRMHPIANFNLSRLRSYKNEEIDVKLFALQGSLGYRVRMPFMSLDVTMNIHQGLIMPNQNSDNYAQFAFYPMLTVRWDGLMDKFKPTFRSVDAVQTKSSVTGQSRTTTNERINGADYRVTRTTTSYQVTSTPVTVAILDIGKYKGIGPKLAVNGFRSLAFRDNTMLVGIQGLYRYNAVVLGGTIEAGKIGHGSVLEERKNKGTASEGNNFYRRLDRSKNQGMGSYTAANVMVDFGFDFSSLKYGLFGLQVADNDATPYTSLSVGYSFGLNMMFNQQFVNASSSESYYENLNTQNQLSYQRDNTYFEDPRSAKFGLMGGWFLSCDIGHASLRMQWYKYRRAPLANGLLFSVAWRFN